MKVCTVLLLYNILGYIKVHIGGNLLLVFVPSFPCDSGDFSRVYHLHRRQLWGMEGMHPQKFTVGDGYITIRQYGCLTLQPSGAQQSSVKYQFYIHFQNNYQLGRGLLKYLIPQLQLLLVRLLDPLLGLRPWTPLGDFCAPGYIPLCVNSSPKVTEPLTSLFVCWCYV